MRLDRRVPKKKSCLCFIGFLFTFFLLLFYSLATSHSQEVKGKEKEIDDKFSSLIENGSRMIRENEFDKVLSEIQALPPEKRLDFRIRVLENSASLKAYLVTKKKEYGRKWQLDYKPMVYTRNMTATPILIDLLKDSDPYMRAFTARALGYLGDQRALEELKKVAQQDPKGKVRSRAKDAYEQLSGGKLPKEPFKED